MEKVNGKSQRKKKGNRESEKGKVNGKSQRVKKSKGRVKRKRKEGVKEKE